MAESNLARPRTLEYTDVNVVLSWLRNQIWSPKTATYFCSHTLS